MTMLAIEHEPVDERWARIADHADPRRDCGYIDQISVTARPSTTKAVDACLGIFSDWLIDHDPNVIAFRQINRRHIEAFKLWLATRENQRGEPLKKSTIRLRLSMLRVVFERLIEWDHPDAPARNPIMWTDLPKMDEPLPKFLDDEGAARFMAAAVRLDPQRRLVVEMLARTGLRVTEFCELTHDAIVTLNETNWLRVPVGKLHTDRYVPLHPSLLELHRTWRDWAGPDDTGRLISNHGRVLNRYTVARNVAASRGSPGSVTSTPISCITRSATQSVNNGMSVEAVSAMLGHRSMRMTLVYARIADRTIADEYLAAADKVDQLYTTHLTTSPA